MTKLEDETEETEEETEEEEEEEEAEAEVSRFKEDLSRQRVYPSGKAGRKEGRRGVGWLKEEMALFTPHIRAIMSGDGGRRGERGGEGHEQIEVKDMEGQEPLR